MAGSLIQEPFPIFAVSGKYLLYDVEVVSYVRREHHVCGVLLGNIPHATQQNLFNGIPLELLPEQARLLVVRGHAYVVDDIVAHYQQFNSLPLDAQRMYVRSLEQKGLAAAQAAKEAAQQRKAVGLAKMKKNRKSKGSSSDHSATANDEFLFDSPSRPDPPVASNTQSTREPWIVLPTTSYPPLNSSTYMESSVAPPETPFFKLFAHLHDKGYFLFPGIRFGCQFVAYPGDPLRFHSHFLVVGKEWNQPIDMMDIVGGGRLGTGVKKSFMLGGVEPSEDSERDDEALAQGTVRTYCFEWAAM
jgi:tRNA-splicing endonuclease subunit Sen34